MSELHTIFIDPEGTHVSEEALRAALEVEADVLISDRAFKQGEETPGGDLEAVEYVVYPVGSNESDPWRPRRFVLWVGLHPDVGCVNVDAGRERLESEGWEVTDWGAA